MLSYRCLVATYPHIPPPIANITSLSCCSNSREDYEIDEVWDLTCDAGTTHTFTKISESDYCMEFRFLRNENGDGTSSGDPWKNGKNGENGDVLHCRIERFGEEWIPKTTDPDYRKDEVIRDCIVPTLSRDSKSAFRGYTIELEIQERTDGLKFWRMVHDCKVTVNEQLNLPMKNMDLWNPGRKNIIYEKIILKSPTFEEEAGFIVPIHFVVLMCMMLYACAHQAQKRWRNECCRSCGKQLTFSAGDVCFWCSFYKAHPTPMGLCW